jgi:pimeloyl-ACP methyl ester carboxylesterase
MMLSFQKQDQGMSDRLKAQFVDRNSCDLVVVFHSMHPAGWTSFFGEKQTRFDFYRILENMDKSALFFMDLQRNWYQDCFDEILNITEETMGLKPFNHIYTLGASYGGYAAIIVASLLQTRVDGCLAFAPQTDLSESTTNKLMKEFGDPAGFSPFDQQKDVVYKQYFDLLPIVTKARDTRFKIVYSNGSAWDKYYAEYLPQSENLEHEGHNFSDHNVGLHLSRQGLLLNTIHSFFES